MIVLLALAAILAVLGLLIGLLPTWTPVDLTGGVIELQGGPFGTVLDYVAWANHYVPLLDVTVGPVTLPGILPTAGVLITIWLAMHAVEALLWLLRKAHVLG